MRQIFLIISFLFFSIAFCFGQEKTDWGAWAQHPCYKGIWFRVQRSSYNKTTGVWTYNSEYHNRYSQKVKFCVGDDIKSADYGEYNGSCLRIVAEPNAVESWYAYSKNPNGVNIYIANVCFNFPTDGSRDCSWEANRGEDTYVAGYAECDNGIPNYKRPGWSNGQSSNNNNYGNTSQQNNTYSNNLHQNNIGNNSNQQNNNSKIENNQNTINVLTQASSVVANLLDDISAANKQRKAEKEAEEKRVEDQKKKAEEQRNNDIINNKDYYFKITSKEDGQMGQYCDYMVKKLQQAGYNYTGGLNQSIVREKKETFEYASKTINIGFKNEKDTLYFTMMNNFSLGEYVNSFTRKGWVMSKKLSSKEVMVIVKNIFQSDIKTEESTIVNNYFEFVINPQTVANNIKGYDFSLTNYKGFSSEINKLSNGETAKDYLANGFKYYGNLDSGDDNDFKQAVFWFTKAAEASGVNAKRMLSMVYFKKNDYKMAEQWAVKAVEAGETSAYRVLGANYSLKGKESDAIYWYKKAIELNDSEAYYLLALLYMNNTGIYKDEKEAERLYLIGAEKGSSNCMSSLISLYLYGSNYGSGIIKKDKSKAKFWKNKLSIANPKLYESLKVYW